MCHWGVAGMNHARSEKYCGKCAHFTLRELPAGTAPGHGRCTMLEISDPHLATPAWDDRGCVIYAPAKKMSERQAWIAKQLPTKEAENVKP